MNNSNILLPELRDIIVQYVLPPIEEIQTNRNKINYIISIFNGEDYTRPKVLLKRLVYREINVMKYECTYPIWRKLLKINIKTMSS